MMESVKRPFELYAWFCATYAVEVIVCFVTMLVAAITVNMQSPYNACQWAFECQAPSNEVPLNGEELIRSDVALLLLVRCGSILSTFVQMKKAWQSGWLVCGMVSVNVGFGALTFATTVFHLLNKDDTALVGSALPVFLIFVDFSRILTLCKYATSCDRLDKVNDNIARGMGAMMPGLTWDLMFKIFSISSLAYQVDVRQLQQIACFACLSVVINYLVYATFVPACLSLSLLFADRRLLFWSERKFSSALHQHDSSVNCSFNLMLCAIHLFKFVIRTYAAHDQLTAQQRFDSMFSVSASACFDCFLAALVVAEFLNARANNLPLDQEGVAVEPPSPSNPVPEPVVDHPLRIRSQSESEQAPDAQQSCRDEEKCLELLKIGADLLSDDEVLKLLERRKLLPYRLEKDLQDANRGVRIRRKLMTSGKSGSGKEVDEEAMRGIPHEHYDFTVATKACCENTIGYMPVPLGLVGPLLLDGEELMVPMATTEGTLLASTNRGMKALHLAGGVRSCVYKDAMTRSPCVEFATVEQCCGMKMWLEREENFLQIKEKFDATSRFARLQEITTTLSGRQLFIRFAATTGDAMGMNMVSKGSQNAMRFLGEKFPEMKLISLSGNFCTDKKASAVNWILGRGKSVVCEAVLPAQVVRNTLKCDPVTLVRLNDSKNRVGSAMSATIGGYNAHAANIVTALYIATGQDPAQVVVSSNCMTELRLLDHDDVLVTCTMPSVEVATVGGGTMLEQQRACLKLLRVAGAHSERAGDNARKLARIVCASVTAGELSLLAALNSGDLVRSHMKHNRLHQGVSSAKPTNHMIL